MMPPDLPATAAPAWAHGEAYADHFDRLASRLAPQAALRRLLVHIDADLDVEEMLALWRVMARCAQALDAPALQAVSQALDGRHAEALRALADGVPPLQRLEALAVHCVATRPDLVRALIARHGSDPLAAPAEHPPRLVLAALRAALAEARPRLAADAVEPLRNALVDATSRDGALLPQGLAVLFELALQAGDDDTATAALAQLVAAGHAAELPAERVREWLEGSVAAGADPAALPLMLAPAWQARWLRPADWASAAPLQALLRALHREAPRRRVAALLAAIGHDGPGPAAGPLPPALQRLSALDAGYALVEQGGNPLPALQPLLASGTLGPAAVAALHRVDAGHRANAGDAEACVLALGRARRAQADAPLRQALADALRALGQLPPLPVFGADWREEEPFWKTLLLDGGEVQRRIAAHQLAVLWTQGHLEPRPPCKSQQLEPARALWQWLGAHPLHAAEARAALRGTELSVMHPARRVVAGAADHLWFECPGAQAATLVFSCAQSHHTHPEVLALRGRLPGRHLMFLRNPDFNWYSDEAFEAAADQVRRVLLPRVDAAHVSCYYGSMGGTGALKLALEFGFRAIVFNPQTDLDLWAAFRARDRARLWAAARHAQPASWPLPAWERMPLYYACGSATPDREALSVVIERLRGCRHASVVIEKFDDRHHSGLFHRIATQPLPAMLTAIDRRLEALAGERPLPGAGVVAAGEVDAFWDRLDRAPCVKAEIQVRDGRLWTQASRSCATR